MSYFSMHSPTSCGESKNRIFRCAMFISTSSHHHSCTKDGVFVRTPLRDSRFGSLSAMTFLLIPGFHARAGSRMRRGWESPRHRCVACSRRSVSLDCKQRRQTSLPEGHGGEDAASRRWRGVCGQHIYGLSRPAVAVGRGGAGLSRRAARENKKSRLVKVGSSRSGA